MWWIRNDPCGMFSAILTVLLILYSQYVIVTVIVYPWYGWHWHIALYTVCSLFALTAHTRAQFTDPGAVPRHRRAPSPPPTDSVDGHEERYIRRLLSTSPSTYQELRLCARPSHCARLCLRCPLPSVTAPRVCKRCRTVKPYRAHHCSTCNRCIVRMDHHCPWVNNCVAMFNQKYPIDPHTLHMDTDVVAARLVGVELNAGPTNVHTLHAEHQRTSTLPPNLSAEEKYFVLFLLYTALCCVYAGVLLVCRFVSCTRDLRQCSITPLQTALCIVNFIEALVFGLFCIIMMADQLSAILDNTPGIDALQHKHGAKRGRYDSLKAVFGEPLGLRWLLPVRLPAVVVSDFDWELTVDAGDYGEPRVKERRDAPAGVDERDVPPFPTLSSALAQAQAQATATAAAAGRMDAVDEDKRTADVAHLGRTGGKRVRHEDDDKEQQQHRSAHPHSTDADEQRRSADSHKTD